MEGTDSDLLVGTLGILLEFRLGDVRGVFIACFFGVFLHNPSGSQMTLSFSAENPSPSSISRSSKGLKNFFWNLN
jgi:hypothetical protein